MLQAMRAQFFVDVQSYLTVRARAEQVSTLLQLASLALEVIKLAIDNDMYPFVLVGDRLIACRQVNDAQPRMTETDALIGGQPGALAVRTTVVQTVRGALQPFR
jgi:hypothetical protein